MKKTYFLAWLFLSGFHVYSADKSEDNKEPLLIYNQFPRIWEMNIDKMKEYLKHIANMGFNCVWLNPLHESSNDIVVTRTDDKKCFGTFKVKKSLYAMDVRIKKETDTDNTGFAFEFNNKKYFCPFHRGITKKKLQSFVDEAHKLNLKVIFDLVLNHVIKKCDFANENHDFIKDDPKFDDVSQFKYEDKKNIDLIYDNIWKNFLKFYITDIGFDGIRVDYATGIKPEVLKKCFSDNVLKKKIIFSEALLPASVNKAEKLNEYKDIGFQNLTNISYVLQPSEDIKKGIAEDLGLKRAISTKNNSPFYRGTIGFAGSHDEGPVTIVVSHHLAEYDYKNNPNYIKEHENLSKNKTANDQHNTSISNLKIKNITGCSALSTMNELSAKDELYINSEIAIATAAFSSDSGWYLLAGDEYLSDVIQSPFVRENENPFDESSKSLKGTGIPLYTVKKDITSFVKAINTVMKKLQYNDDATFFYVKKHMNWENKTLTFERYFKKLEDENDSYNKTTKDKIIVDFTNNNIKLNSNKTVNF